MTAEGLGMRLDAAIRHGVKPGWDRLHALDDLAALLKERDLLREALQRIGDLTENTKQDAYVIHVIDSIVYETFALAPPTPRTKGEGE